MDDKEHLVVTKSDFIFERKGKFNEFYKTDDKILGEGRFFIKLLQVHLERCRSALKSQLEQSMQ